MKTQNIKKKDAEMSSENELAYPTKNKVTFFWKSDKPGVNSKEKRVETSVNRGCNLKMV